MNAPLKTPNLKTALMTGSALPVLAMLGVGLTGTEAAAQANNYSAGGGIVNCPPGVTTVAWARCFPNACYASAQLKDDILKSWPTKTQAGRVLYLNGAGQVTAIPISFRGLGQATEALNKMK